MQQATSASAVLNRLWNGYLPVDVYGIAQAYGIEIREEPLDDALSGYISIENGRPIMRVNVDDIPVRRRFTVAHELGHFVLGHVSQDGETCLRDTRSNYSMSSSWQEREANHFAASLLMPAHAVEYVIRNGDATTLNDLTRMFGVSRAAMQYRAGNLGILDV